MLIQSLTQGSMNIVEYFQFYNLNKINSTFRRIIVTELIKITVYWYFNLNWIGRSLSEPKSIIPWVFLTIFPTITTYYYRLWRLPDNHFRCPWERVCEVRTLKQMFHSENKRFNMLSSFVDRDNTSTISFLFVCFSLYLLIWKRFVELTFCIVINVLEFGEEHVLKRLPASRKN